MQKKDKVLLLIVCMILGIFLSVQFKVIQKNFASGGLMPNQKLAQMSIELKQLKEEKETLLKELAEYEGRLSAIENTASQENVVIKNLKEELNKYKLIGGFKDVKGEGIVLSIDNPPKDVNFNYDVNIAYEFELILNVINELNAAGAEAISVNDQRIISTTEIRTAGNAININSIPQSPPYVIKSIGNKDTLDGAVNQIFGIVSILRDRRYQVSVRKLDEVVIPRYNDIIRIEYANTIEED